MPNRYGLIKKILLSFILLSAVLLFPAYDNNLPTTRAQNQGKEEPVNPSFDLSYLQAKARKEGVVRIFIDVKLDRPFRAEGLFGSQEEITHQRLQISEMQDRVIESMASMKYTLKARYKSIPSMALNVDEEALLYLSTLPSVTKIQERGISRLALQHSVPWIHANDVQSLGAKGEGYTIAIIDSGIQANHPTFQDGWGQSRVVYEACYSDPGIGLGGHSLCPNGSTSQTGGGSTSPTITACQSTTATRRVNDNICYHGTHVAGIAAGSNDIETGVAPAVKIIAFQVFYRQDELTGFECEDTGPCIVADDGDVISALEQLHDEQGTTFKNLKIAAVNLSLGHGRYYSECDNQESRYYNAISNLVADGIGVVAATGNDYWPDSMQAPACLSNVVSVASSYSYCDDNFCSSGFNNIDGMLDLFAPGDTVKSSVPDNAWEYLQGTSMAAPHVAGAWVLMKQIKPSASYSEIKNALTNTGPLIEQHGISRHRIDVLAAGQYLDSIPPNIPSLISPSPGMALNDVTPTLSWSEISDASMYELEIATDSSFSNIIWYEQGDYTSTTLSSMSDRWYYWHVRARDLIGNWSNWSNYNSFKIDTVAPDPPPLASPENNSKINNNTPTFEWISASGANDYVIQVDNNQYFSSPEINQVVQDYRYTPSTGLSDGLYYWRVQARDSVPNISDWSTVWTVTIDATKPLPPNPVYPENNTSTTDTTPTFEWTTPNTAVEFHIQIDNNSSFSSPERDAYTTNDYYTPPTLGNETYSWRVQARDDVGNWSDWSTVYNVTITTPTPPSAFGKSSPGSGSSDLPNNPTISWQPSSPITKYEYCLDTTNDNNCTGWTDNGANTSINLNGLSNGVTYYWQVRAFNGTSGPTYANGSSTAYWSFTTAANPPQAFNKVSPYDGAPSQSSNLTLSWQSSSLVTKYEYCLDTTDDDGCSNWIDNGINTSVNLTGLENNVIYYWHVRAFNGNVGPTYSNGSSSAFWSFSTSDSFPTAFGKISPANGAVDQSIDQTFNWQPTNPVTYYEFCYDRTNDNACSSWIYLGNNTSVSLSGLSYSAKYYWQVRAWNGSLGPIYADGSLSTFYNFTTISDPSHTFTVNSTTDNVDNNIGDGICATANQDCTLRGAIQEANAMAGKNTVLIPAGFYLLTLAGTDEDNSATGDLDIKGDLTIIGSGQATTIIDGGGIDRILELHNETAVIDINHLTLQNGNSPGIGGGVLNRGLLKLIDIRITGNRGGSGGGIFHGATLNDHLLSIIDSSIDNNQSSGFGGGIAGYQSSITLVNAQVSNNTASASGGGVYIDNNRAVLTVNSSTISSNSTNDCGGGVYSSKSPIILENAQIINNSSYQSGGGIISISGQVQINGNTKIGGVGLGNKADANLDNAGAGGGIYISGSTLSITGYGNSIVGNEAAGGGGIFISGGVTNIENTTIAYNIVHYSTGGGGIYNNSEATLTNVTISSNTSWYGGGIGNYSSTANMHLVNVTITNNLASKNYSDGISHTTDSKLYLENTIVANNDNGGCSGSGTIISSGHNLGSDSSCNLTQVSDLIVTDPLLGLLQDNGGSTLTHTLLPGSLAIDRGNNATCPATDQRNEIRPKDGNGDGGAICDIGAFETNTLLPAAFDKNNPVNGATGITYNPTLSWNVSTETTSYDLCYDTYNNNSCDSYWINTGVFTNTTLTGLDSGVTYYWQVRANNVAGDTYANAGSWWSFTIVQYPPSSFNKINPANGFSDISTSPTLSWNNSSEVYRFEYCYDTTNDNYCNGTWVSTETITYVKLEGLSVGSTYYWQVRAINPAGTTNADDNTWWSFTTVPSPPATFTKSSPVNGATNVSTTQTLRWDSSPNAAFYEYCVDTSNDNTCQSNWISVGKNTSVYLNNLNWGTKYYWQVKSSNSSGAMYANSNTWWSFSTVPKPPGTFYKTTPTNNLTNSPTNPILNWSSSSQATGYEYCIDTINDNICNAYWISTEMELSIGLGGLHTNTIYYWQVRATNAGGVTYSNGDIWWSFVTLPNPPGMFSKISPVNLSKGISSSPTLRWESSSDTTIYEYCYDTSNDNSCSGNWISSGTATTVTLSDLTINTTYYWQVRAINIAGVTYANNSWFRFTVTHHSLYLPLITRGGS